MPAKSKRGKKAPAKKVEKVVEEDNNIQSEESTGEEEVNDNNVVESNDNESEEEQQEEEPPAKKSKGRGRPAAKNSKKKAAPASKKKGGQSSRSTSRGRKPAAAPAKKEEEEESEDETEYEVDKVLESRSRKGIREFRIKWKGYRNTTWEPETNLSCDDAIKDFEENEKKRKETPGADLRRNRKETQRLVDVIGQGDEARRRHSKRHGTQTPRKSYKEDADDE